jgi:hypothetical protein
MLEKDIRSRAARRHPQTGQDSANLAVDSPEPEGIKKPYSAPRLTIYGALNSNTGTSHHGGKNDHAHGNHKTN